MIPHTMKYLISRSISSADIPHVTKYLINRSTSSREVYRHAIYLITRGTSSHEVPHQVRYPVNRGISGSGIPHHVIYLATRGISWRAGKKLASWQMASCENAGKLRAAKSYKRWQATNVLPAKIHSKLQKIIFRKSLTFPQIHGRIIVFQGGKESRKNFKKNFPKTLDKLPKT